LLQRVEVAAFVVCKQLWTCKSVMPLWLERIKNDKVWRSVKHAQSICHWHWHLGQMTTALTWDIKFQVGTSYLLICHMRDASPTVWTKAKGGIKYICVAQLNVCHCLLHDPGGWAAMDPERVDSLSVDLLKGMVKMRVSSDTRWDFRLVFSVQRLVLNG
jgi:hypothetical protein